LDLMSNLSTKEYKVEGFLNSGYTAPAAITLTSTGMSTPGKK